MSGPISERAKKAALKPEAEGERVRAKEMKKLERKLERAEEQLKNYERLVDRTQHLLNTRIAEVEAAREELKESEARFRQLADAAFEAILTHTDDRILDCNEAALHLYQLSKEELIGSPVLDRVHLSFHARAAQWLHESTREPVELTHLRGDGTPLPVEVRSRTIIHQGALAMVTAVRDITSHKQMELELRKLANSDPLTGAGNRRFFMETGNREFFRAVRYQQHMSLMMIDIDHFKIINDTYGHDAGDTALCALTEMCRTTLRDSDLVARIGGEEFAAVLPNTNLAGAVILAERLRARVEAGIIQTARGPVSLTVSVGVTENQSSDQNVETLLSRADAALYAAKSAGRNRVEKGS